ncbi:MAG: hypothetical protein D6734_10840, partial [Candidatus Schekmanbacteria bacterium]
DLKVKINKKYNENSLTKRTDEKEIEEVEISDNMLKIGINRLEVEVPDNDLILDKITFSRIR